MTVWLHLKFLLKFHIEKQCSHGDLTLLNHQAQTWNAKCYCTIPQQNKEKIQNQFQTMEFLSITTITPAMLRWDSSLSKKKVSTMLFSPWKTNGEELTSFPWKKSSKHELLEMIFCWFIFGIWFYLF